MKNLAVVLLLCLSLLVRSQAGPAPAAQEGVYEIDFTQQPEGSAVPWLKAHGWEFKLQGEALAPRFHEKALWLSTRKPESGMITMSFPPGKGLSPAAKFLRITWGVQRFPEGADWTKGMNRTPLGVMVSFGSDKLPSGLPFGVYAAPYFLCPFFAAKAPAGQVFTGKYWKQGGRYVAVRAGKPGETVVSEVELEPLFRASFGKDAMPGVSGIGLQVNTKDLPNGVSEAFIRKIELLKGK